MGRKRGAIPNEVQWTKSMGQFIKAVGHQLGMLISYQTQRADPRNGYQVKVFKHPSAGNAQDSAATKRLPLCELQLKLVDGQSTLDCRLQASRTSQLEEQLERLAHKCGARLQITNSLPTTEPIEKRNPQQPQEVA